MAKIASRKTATVTKEQEAPTRGYTVQRTPSRVATPAREPVREREPEKVQRTTSSAVSTTRANPVASISTDLSMMPTFMEGDIGKGREAMTQSDLEVPRLKLIQGISPELQEFDDLRAGHFLHTATEAIFDEPFLAVPIYMDRRYILWRPRDMGGGILARADDGMHWSPPNVKFTVKLDKKDGGHEVSWTTRTTVPESGLDAWGSMNPNDPESPPAATLMYNFLLAFPEHPDILPAVLTFQRSSLGRGKKFNTKLSTIRAPLFGLVFRFSSFVDTNKGNQEFMNMKAESFGKITDKETYDYYKGLYESFSQMGLKIKDIEGAQDEGVVDSDAAPEGAPAF